MRCRFDWGMGNVGGACLMGKRKRSGFVEMPLRHHYPYDVLLQPWNRQATRDGAGVQVVFSEGVLYFIPI